jgi:hypothetical protein
MSNSRTAAVRELLRSADRGVVVVVQHALEKGFSMLILGWSLLLLGLIAGLYWRVRFLVLAYHRNLWWFAGSHTIVHTGPRTAVPGRSLRIKQHSFSATMIAARSSASFNAPGQDHRWSCLPARRGRFRSYFGLMSGPSCPSL